MAEPEPPTSAEDPAANDPKKRAKRRRVLILGGGVTGVVALAGAVIYLIATRGKESTDDAQVQADVIPLAPRVGGPVLEMPIVENQHVDRGALILVIDDADYRERARQAEGDLLQARAGEAQAEAELAIARATATGGFHSASAEVSGSEWSVRGADAAVAAARAAVTRAEAEDQNAETELQRDAALLAAKAISQQQLDNAHVAAVGAREALRQARSNLVAAEEQRTVAVARVAEARGKLTQSRPVEEQVAQAEAKLDLAKAKVFSAESALTFARLQLSYTRLAAPEAGVVSSLGVHVGQLVAAEQPVCELVPDEAYVVANFKETQIGDMREGQRAKISVDAYSGSFEGAVESLSGGTGARFALLPPDNATGNFVKVVQRVPVRIALVRHGRDVRLRAGLSADVTVYVNERR